MRICCVLTVVSNFLSRHQPLYAERNSSSRPHSATTGLHEILKYLMFIDLHLLDPYNNLVSHNALREWWNGRHACLRGKCRKAWRFDSSLAHQRIYHLVQRPEKPYRKGLFWCSTTLDTSKAFLPGMSNIAKFFFLFQGRFLVGFVPIIGANQTKFGQSLAEHQ